jgi:hypothetical protein
MNVANASPASAALGVRLELRFTVSKTPSKPLRLSPVGNTAGEASGNEIT